MSDDEKVKTNQKLSQSVTKIMALAEAYPELKANENFKELSKDLSKIEEDIANLKSINNSSTISSTEKEAYIKRIMDEIYLSKMVMELTT